MELRGPFSERGAEVGSEGGSEGVSEVVGFTIGGEGEVFDDLDVGGGDIVE